MAKGGLQRTLRKTVQKNDFAIILLTLILVLFGVIMVFSASYYYSIAKNGSPYHWLIRDGIYAFGGIVLMLVFSRINYKKYKKWAPLVFFLILVMLALLFVPGLGRNVNGATRWLDLKVITIMPGELAKLGIVLYFSMYLSRKHIRLENPKTVLWCLFVLIVPVLLILKQPNMSTAMTVAFVGAAILFVEGLSWKWIISLGGLGAAGAVALIIHEGGYKMARVASFMHPFDDELGDGWQVVQGLIGMGSGGLFGKGLGRSIVKNLYVPEPQNDFIFAIIGEELGFIGVALLLLVYLLLVWKVIKVALNAPDKFGMLLCSGIAAMVAVQVILNVAVVTSTMPPTGVALPFISYGGNSMLMFCAAIGMVLNVSYNSEKLREEE